MNLTIAKIDKWLETKIATIGIKSRRTRIQQYYASVCFWKISEHLNMIQFAFQAKKMYKIKLSGFQKQSSCTSLPVFITL